VNVYTLSCSVFHTFILTRLSACVTMTKSSPFAINFLPILLFHSYSAFWFSFLIVILRLFCKIDLRNIPSKKEVTIMQSTNSYISLLWYVLNTHNHGWSRQRSDLYREKALIVTSILSRKLSPFSVVRLSKCKI